MATPVKYAARIDNHARGVYFSCDDSLSLNLDTSLGKDYAVKAAGDHDAVSFNLPFDFGSVAKDDGLL